MCGQRGNPTLAWDEIARIDVIVLVEPARGEAVSPQHVLAVAASSRCLFWGIGEDFDVLCLYKVIIGNGRFDSRPVADAI